MTQASEEGVRGDVSPSPLPIAEDPLLADLSCERGPWL